MTIDIPHMLVTAAIIFAVLFAVEHLGWTAGASRGRRALIIGLAVFLPLLILNLIWPYGGA